MFTTPNIKTYIHDVFPDIDGEKRMVRMRCYVNPVSSELASEVHKEIAATLFHRVGSEFLPRLMLSHCKFGTTFGPQSLTFCRDPEYANSRVMIPTIEISKLEAGKVTPDSNDFALMFTVSFEKNDPKVLNELSDLLHEHVYLTFRALQPGLFEEEPAENPELVTEAAAEVIAGLQRLPESDPPRVDPLAEDINKRNQLSRRKKER